PDPKSTFLKALASLACPPRPDDRSFDFLATMANNVISIDKLKAFWHSEVHDEQKWAVNMKLVRALGIFAGGVFLMRSYGDLMAV
ncbi:hypothetical protein CARUB_v10002362mg, partial [Capsella rubella]